MADDKSIIPVEEELLESIDKITFCLDKAYMQHLEEDPYQVISFERYCKKEGSVTYEENIRAVQVKKWVFDKDEKPGECFKNVLSSFSDGKHTLALVIKRLQTGTEMYFVVKNQGPGKNASSKNQQEFLLQSLKGNFQGSSVDLVESGKTASALDFEKFKEGSITVQTNIPSEFSEDHITQGIDKILNGIVPSEPDEEYSIVFLAESLGQDSVNNILSGYEDLATAIVPFLQHQFQIGDGTVKTSVETKSISNSKSISEAITRTSSLSFSLQGGAGEKAGGTFGYGYSCGKTHGTSDTTTDGRSNSRGIATIVNKNTTYTYKSYMIANLLERLELSMKRIKVGNGTGLWKYSTYVLSKNSRVGKNVASFIIGLTQGKDSYVEPSFIQQWNWKRCNEKTKFDEIFEYVTNFTHPAFFTSKIDNQNGEKKVQDVVVVSPTSYIATDELGYRFCFPRNSVQGLPVLEGVQFGREPHLLNEKKLDLEIGHGYHMYEDVKNQKIFVSKKELTKHTFITGSTGAGKSNTIYSLLSGLSRKRVKFLVVEPAKGEYKDTLGKELGVIVYGTNPLQQNVSMLRLNPFRFPSKIHVLEHIDRLVEIFNVCWPMYAAMPAILKEAVEKAYQDSGWNLKTSQNRISTDLFPSFSDVLHQIKIILDESYFSADNKGDYTGALVTRLKSLTNGINGQVFSSDDISDEDLFDKNVIVDLSRVGASETKSLIMGILVLKLQEHRMEKHQFNSDLKHVTVLEEAHHLLKRTSTEQVSEGANLLGKSVEMLANSIAEMRTYGEGFIIADQTPGLLDMSVIRNTNTKIIMRLMDEDDRLLVGKAAGLNDNQITELVRLDQGVAVVSQSGWLEPVLCRISKYEVPKPNDSKPDKKQKQLAVSVGGISVKNDVLDGILTGELYRKSENISNWEKEILRSDLSGRIKAECIDFLSADGKEKPDRFARFVYDYFNVSDVLDKVDATCDLDIWIHAIINKLNLDCEKYNSTQIETILSAIVLETGRRNVEYSNLATRYANYYKERGHVL